MKYVLRHFLLVRLVSVSPVRPSNLVAGVLFVSSDVAYVCGEHVDREKSRLPTEIPSRITLTQEI